MESTDAAIDAPVPAEREGTSEELAQKLDQLKASATQQYSLKNYPAAAELYSEAAEVQEEINGEMSPENADLLYQYGRCLYHVAVANSDVLGGKVAGGEEPKRKKRKTAKTNGEGSSASAAGSSGSGLISDALKDGEQKLAEEVVEAAVESKDGMKEGVKQENEPSVASKPYFQITGDENWTDSEEEDEEATDAAADAEAEEEEDDFAIAYEILDVARVLLTRKLDLQEGSADVQRQIKERLADSHDLQAEINLENERFTDAIQDTRAGLALKLELYPEESSLIAEAHFKLSLALEFASVTSTSTDENAGGTSSEETTAAQVDEKLRGEAATEMELAIASCTARINKETSLLPSLESNPSKLADQQRSIADVKEMVAEMRQRLVDLRNPAISLSGMNAQAGPAGAPDGTDPLRGVLGAMLGESEGERKKRIAEATAGANDLSGLVKHRKKPKADSAAPEAVIEGKGKRKAEEVADAANGVDKGKKVKFAASVEDE